MKAIVFCKSCPGEVRVEERPVPQPAAGEVLIRVHLAGICSTDLEIIRGYMGFEGVLGHEFVGTVERGPAELLGKRVVAEINCVLPDSPARDEAARKHAVPRTVLGIFGRDGAMAEYVAVPAENCHVVPESVSDREAVFAEPVAAAIQVVTDHPVERGTRAIVLGSGRLGILCAQVLANAGATVTVVGRNERTLSKCAALGLKTAASGNIGAASQDLVVECTGSPDGLREAIRCVRPRGTIVLKSTYSADPPPSFDLSPIVIHEITLAGNRCGPIGQAVRMLAERQVAVEPLVDAEFVLADGVAAFAAAGRAGALKVLLRCGEK